MPWKSDIDLFCLSVGIPEPTRKWIFKCEFELLLMSKKMEDDRKTFD